MEHGESRAPARAIARGVWAAFSAASIVAATGWSTAAVAGSGDVLDEIVIRGQRLAPQELKVPMMIESVTANDVAAAINATNTEDVLKYLPNVLIRKRHIGDTQAPMTTRTSGVGASARSLIYADGVLLSALIANNNTIGSPKWGMVAPEEIERVDVMYGPFAAAYPGNSMGAVVEITTRMPQDLEISGKVQNVWQRFSQYGTRDTYPARQYTAFVGSTVGRVAWWLSANHLDSRSQPLAYATVTRPAATSGAGAPATGSFPDVNRTGAPILVLGGGGMEHQRQDNISGKVRFDISPVLRLTYMAGLFVNDDDAAVESYLRDGAGQPVYAGSLNLDGYNVNVPASAFSNNFYRLDERQLMQSVALKSQTGGPWNFDVVFSDYNYLKATQRFPTTALPAAAAGGAGTLTDGGATGWRTLDAKAIWKPAESDHEVSFGGHFDRYVLGNARYNTAHWIDGPRLALASDSKGKTRSYALWAQDVWTLTQDLALTLGGRYEDWRAFDGLNYSLAPALDVKQPQLTARRLSPKASVRWVALDDVVVTASFGMAYRFPTVSELYQAITTGATLTTPNPNLKPEQAISEELSVEKRFSDGSLRLSVFQEHINDALISQSAPLVAGSTTLFNYVQNVEQVRARGAELVGSWSDVAVQGLELSGSVSFVDPQVTKNPVFPVSIGKQTPQIPQWRATLVATYRPDDKWTLTLAGRYSDRIFATIDNSDIVGHTFQGFEGYLVMDARVHYQINAHWSAAVGVDNFNGRDYFLFHPFPQRAVSTEVKFSY
ncbi:MAG: TonB-dependent receptor [Rhodospirillaceae bacterium]|nr:TonB-dependent receptor [Rhodospirillaceae bacterium]